MSIAFPMHDNAGGRIMSLGAFPPAAKRQRRAANGQPRAKRPGQPVSERRLRANRENARKSTGPRTPEGKARVSRNAVKHGLCCAEANLPGECGATYEIFRQELEDELQPRTVIQKTLVSRIIPLAWNLERMPDAMRTVHCEESKRLTGKPRSPACHVIGLAMCDAGNGFTRLARYERSMESMMLRLLRQFYWFKKHHPTSSYPDDSYTDDDDVETPAQARVREKRDMDELLREIRERNKASERERWALQNASDASGTQVEPVEPVEEIDETKPAAELTPPPARPTTMPMEPMSYESAGVNYDRLDAFKRACQRAAGTTVEALAGHDLREPAAVRGESAYLLETPEEYLAHVEEGLGTKNLVADAMLEQTGRSFYRGIGIDTVATMVNDLITCGALPISVAMHAAVGDASWFDHAQRNQDLADGFAEGCRLAGAVWGGGETPALKGIVEPKTIVLAGSAVGRIRPKSHRITGRVGDGDAIVMLASSGVHTNGLTLCRAIAGRLPQGYLTPIDDGRPYGEALLDPSVIYVRFIAACQQAGIDLHYAVHLTGHGWRKLMRLDEPFVYRITELRESPAIFPFLVKAGPVDLREAYATFNMGAGFAVYVDPADAARCLEVAAESGYDAWQAGVVRKQGERKAVEIPSLDITFEGETLQVR